MLDKKQIEAVLRELRTWFEDTRSLVPSDEMEICDIFNMPISWGLRLKILSVVIRDKRIWRTFECDCAEKVMNRAAGIQLDERTVHALKMGRADARGEASADDVKRAHRDACSASAETNRINSLLWNAANEACMAVVPDPFEAASGMCWFNSEEDDEWQRNRLLQILEEACYVDSTKNTAHS